MGAITVQIGRFKDGSSSAFGALFGCFLSGVRRNAERLLALGHLGLQKSEDIAQDVFFSLWREVTSRRRRVFDNLCDEPSLHLTLALLTRQQVRRARRYDRQAARDAALTVPLPAEAAGAGEGANGITPAFLRDLEAKDALTRLVELLDHPIQRAIVWLLLDEVPKKEIAVQLGCSARNVRRHLLTILDVWRTHPRARRTLADLGISLSGESRP